MLNYETSSGYEASKLSKGYGLKLDEWQENIIYDWLGINKAGKFVHKTCGLAVARQNGKNALLEARELFGLIFLHERILHTAHEVKTHREAFIRLTKYFTNDSYPELKDLVRIIRYANGQEAIELKNGAVIRFIARSKSSGLGFSADCVVLDEAQILEDMELETLIPTLSTSKNRQIILTGTPPKDYIRGEKFRQFRELAKQNKKKNAISWHEWSVSEIGDVKDKERWERVNPAYKIRISSKNIEGELSLLGDAGFARERLGYWSMQSVKSVIDIKTWERLYNPKPNKHYDKICYGIAFSTNLQYVSLSVAIKSKDSDTIHLEHIKLSEIKDGLSWLVEWILTRIDKVNAVYIDGLLASQFLQNFDTNKTIYNKKLYQVKVKDVINAHVSFFSAISENKLTHYNQSILNEAVMNAGKRTIGNLGGWAFRPIDTNVSITPITSALLAFYACKTTRLQKGIKKQKVITI